MKKTFIAAVRVQLVALLSFVALAAGTLAYSQPVIAQVDASKEICKGVGIVGGGGG